MRALSDRLFKLFGFLRVSIPVELGKFCVVVHVSMIPVLRLVLSDEAHLLRWRWSPEMGHDAQRCSY